MPDLHHRRQLLVASASLGLAALCRPVLGAAERLLPAATRPRVVIIGGGWSGLAAARRLRELAPKLDVVLLEARAEFFSLPLSNRELAGQIDLALLQHDRRAAAARFGYTLIQTRVSHIDREQRQIRTEAGSLGYDWLILAEGIRHHYTPWFGDDKRAAAHAATRFGCAYTPDLAEHRALKARLAAYRGGNLLLTIPPAPYRCPPAPYERAIFFAQKIKAARLPGKVILLDPNPMLVNFGRTFHQQYEKEVLYVPQAQIQSIDPFAQVVRTDFEEFAFSEALLMPPQQAGDLAWQAGLIGRDAAGQPTGWADQDPRTLAARDDPRVFIVGDAIGKVSLLFGHYPKSGHLAAGLGRIAAQEIASRAGERPAQAPELPESICYVYSSAEPLERFEMDVQYRLRGDGVIAQNLKQTYDPQPRDEDVSWAKEQFKALFGA